MQRVILRLGKPDDISKIKKPLLTVFNYDSINCTLEFTEDSSLYSIKIRADNELLMYTDSLQNVYDNFKKLIKKGKYSIDLMKCFRPDIEIYYEEHNFGTGGNILYSSQMLSNLDKLCQNLKKTD